MNEDIVLKFVPFFNPQCTSEWNLINKFQKSMLGTSVVDLDPYLGAFWIRNRIPNMNPEPRM